MGVAIIEQMESGSTPKKFTEDLFDSWGVGDRKCNNGAVFMISVKDRQWCDFLPLLFLFFLFCFVSYICIVLKVYCNWCWNQGRVDL